MNPKSNACPSTSGQHLRTMEVNLFAWSTRLQGKLPGLAAASNDFTPTFVMEGTSELKIHKLRDEA